MEAGASLLPTFDQRLRDYVQKIFVNRPEIRIHTKTSVKEVKESEVELTVSPSPLHTTTFSSLRLACSFTSDTHTRTILLLLPHRTASTFPAALSCGPQVWHLHR